MITRELLDTTISNVLDALDLYDDATTDVIRSHVVAALLPLAAAGGFRSDVSFDATGMSAGGSAGGSPGA